MNIEYNSNSQVCIKLPNGKGVTLLYREKTDEITIVFDGDGHRNIKEVQNRIDGYSSCAFTEQK